MSAYNKFGVTPTFGMLIKPQAVNNATVASNRFDLSKILNGSIVVSLGTIAASTTITVALNVAKTAATDETPTAMGGRYRESIAAGEKTWGDITDIPVGGIALTAADSNKTLLIDVDGSAAEAALSGGRFARLLITSDKATDSYAQATASFTPRYAEGNPARIVAS